MKVFVIFLVLVIVISGISYSYAFSNELLIFAGDEVRKVYYTGNNILSAKFVPDFGSVLYETGHNATLEIKAPQVFKNGPGLFVLKDGEEIAPETTTDDCFYYMTIETQNPSEIEILFVFWPEYPETVENCETFTVAPLKQTALGIPSNEIQCRQNLILVQKYDRTPACVTESTKQKLVERGWINSTQLQELIQRLEYNPHKTLEILPKDAKFIEQLALQDPVVANFVSEIDWKSECCKDTFMVETQEYEISLTIQRLDKDNHLRVIFDRDTLEIMDITNDRHIRHTLITPELGKSGIYELEKNGTEFDIKYHIKGGSDIQEIISDKNSNKLNIILEPYDSGSLEITLPRKLIDAKISEDVDDLFFVLIDGKEVPYDETTNETLRTLTINFEKNSKKIEIIGVMPI